MGSPLLLIEFLRGEFIVKQSTCPTALTAWLAIIPACGLFIGCGETVGAFGPAEVSGSGSQRAESELTDGMPLVPSTKVLDFGIVPQGSRHRLYFELRNSTGRAIKLDRVETTCECLEVNVARREIASGETVIAAASLDLTRAAHFTGRLEIAVKYLASEGAIESPMTIDVDVRPPGEFATLDVDLAEPSSDMKDAVPRPTPMH